MRFAIVDIETTGLNAEKAIILAARVAPLDGQARLIGLHTHGLGPTKAHLDSRVVRALKEEMESFDGWITWYGLLFDLPFIDDRLLLNGLDPLERRFARGLDMIYHASWGKGTFEKRNLEHVAYHLGYPAFRLPLSKIICENAKEEAEARFRGGRKFYNMVVDHNAGCVDMTRFCYDKLRNRVVTVSKR